MKFSKTLLTLATTAFVVTGFFAVPAAVVHAVDSIDQTNEDTGNNSVNENKAKVKRTKKIVKKNKAKVKNNVSAHGNTGGHVVKNNTTAGNVNSGNVGGGVTLANTVNQTADADCCCGENSTVTEVDIDQTNEDTGNNSVNKNKATVKDKTVCIHITEAKVKNNVSLSGNTGGHTVQGNTTVGSVDSGNVTFTIGITNTVN